MPAECLELRKHLQKLLLQHVSQSVQASAALTGVGCLNIGLEDPDKRTQSAGPEAASGAFQRMQGQSLLLGIALQQTLAYARQRGQS